VISKSGRRSDIEELYNKLKPFESCSLCLGRISVSKNGISTLLEELKKNKN
jgi:acetolactate synthase-1/3 small subunit